MPAWGWDWAYAAPLLPPWWPTSPAPLVGETYGIFNTARMSGVVIGPIVAGLAADMQGIKGALYAFTLIALTVTLIAVAIRGRRRTLKEDPESAPDEDGIGQG